MEYLKQKTKEIGSYTQSKQEGNRKKTKAALLVSLYLEKTTFTFIC